MTNAGTSAAAGLVTGAWTGRSGASNAVEGECGLSRKSDAVLAGASAVSERCSLQGSGDSFVRSGWCRAYTTTKGLTGSMYLPEICAGDWSIFSRRSLEGRERSHETGSGEPVFCGGGPTADADRVSSHDQCRRGFSGVKGSMDWRGTIQECSAPLSFTAGTHRWAVW